MSRIALLFLIISMSVPTAFAQTFERLFVDFEINQVTLKDPLTGGLNAPQLSEVDVNEDSVPDLYIFDRIGFVHLPFLNHGTPTNPEYKFAPEYAGNFPDHVGNFVLLRDFDGDGIMDLFGHANTQSAPTSVKVFKGKYENGKIAFDRLFFDDSDFLNYEDDGGQIRPIEISEPDYPSIADIDGDGDLDVLTFDLAGSHVLFFQNRSVEEGFGLEKLIFTLADDCWGRFLEDMTSPDLILSDDVTECAQGFTNNEVDDRNTIHPGSTLLCFDADNDGDFELALGDISYPKISLLTNNGSVGTAWMTDQDVNYPSSDVSVEIPDFPGTFLLDLDGDQIKDFAAAPNNKNQTPNVDVLWFYKNFGSNEIPDFVLQQKDFLVEGMVDLGTGAYPAFADVNADGLTDLVVGNLTYFVGNEKDSRLHYFENIGSLTEPKFKLTDDNWLNFKQFSDIPQPNGSFGFAPGFGDLDNDGDEDLVVGEEEGFLFFVRNNAGPDNPMTFDFPQFGWQGIDAGQFAIPQIADMNRDGLPDLVIGRHRATVYYFQNIGTPDQPTFNPDEGMAPNSEKFGGMEAASFLDIINPIAFGTPTVLDFGNSFKILLGSEKGTIRLYGNIEGNLDGDFDLLSENFGNTKEGFRTRPALADINNDGFLDMVVGNLRGGFSFFSTNLTVDGVLSSNEPENDSRIHLFPNPSGSYVKINFEKKPPRNSRFKLMSHFGQDIMTGILTDMETTIRLDDIPAGIYFLVFNFDGNKAVRKFVKK